MGEIMKRLTIALATLYLAAPAAAKDIIRCTSKNAPEVVMSLEARKMLNKTVSCISGEFIADMTPCATNGGYGLSHPTGSASLREIVSRWQDYGDHHGGVTHHFVTPEKIHFDGGWMSDSFKTQWSFTADRLTGRAKLVIEKGEDREGQYEYVCSRVKQKF